MSKVSRQNGKSYEYLSKFFKNPVVVFSASFLFALFTVLFAERRIQIIGIVTVGAIYTFASICFAIWHEQISAEGLRRENKELKTKIETLTKGNEKLTEERDCLEKEVPKVFAHTAVKKRIEILDPQGTANFYMAYEGKNISGRPIRKVKHVIVANEKLTENKIRGAKFNTEDVHPILANIQYGNAWRNEITLESSEPTEDQAAINTQYEATLEKEYTEGFLEDKRTISYHEVAFRTDKFVVEIIAPKGFYFLSPDINVRDVFNDIEIDAEKDRIIRECSPVLRQNKGKLVWEVIKPRISYRYALLFALRKR